MFTSEELEKLVRKIHPTLWKRRALNEVPEYRIWEELEEQFEFDEEFRRNIREKAEELELNWVGISAGLYVGLPGEQAKEINYRTKWIRSFASNMRKRIMIMGRTGKLNEVKDFSKETGIELNKVPAMLKALGAPLSDEAARVLTKK